MESSRWPSRTLLREKLIELISDQLVDPATADMFLLVSTTSAPARGPWVLCRISLTTGAARVGPAFSVSSLTTASGYLWIYGSPGPDSTPGISQVDPLTLRRIRSIPLPSVPSGVGGVAVAAGPAGSVWIAGGRTLQRVSVSTGATITKVTVPAGLTVSDISVDPAGTALYVSAAHLVRGDISGLILLEYDDRSGRKLATASGGFIRYSVAGAELTAVPGGVWVSFRTGMAGLTIHLGQNGLRMLTPPGPGIPPGPPGVFHWEMNATTSYGGGALWIAQGLGILACVNAQTGHVRARERSAISRLLSIDATAHVIFALDNDDLVRITPPRRCWS